MNITEELLELVSLKGTTTGRDIKDAVKNCAQSRQIDFKNLVGIVTDGATSMRSEVDVSKELVWGCLLYDFKVGLLAAASSRQICQAFGDSAISERMVRHWFQKLRSGDLSLCDKARTGRP
ncbi:histone-lysine N-methyltransferase SETMAR [Trichonephila clavipes]|nr:histone-lysine N-methyltransferase SETMAR [Trichonephila clavipes]